MFGVLYDSFVSFLKSSGGCLIRHVDHMLIVITFDGVNDRRTRRLSLKKKLGRVFDCGLIYN